MAELNDKIINFKDLSRFKTRYDEKIENENKILKANIKALEYVVNNSNRLNYTGQVITNSNSVTGDIKNVIINGNTRYKKTDGSYTDTWESGVSLESVGEKEKDSNNKYPIEIVNCGKNLFSTELFDTIKSITHCQNCSWNKSTGVLHLQWDGIVTYPVLLKPKVKENTQYVLSFEIQSETNWTPNGIRIKYTDGSESYPSATLSTSTDFQKVATKSTANKTIAYIYWVGNNTINIKNIQLELSNDFTTYEPYKENKRTILLDSPLRKVGEVADILDLDNSQVTKKCKTINIDGSSDENWTYAGNNIFALPFSGYRKVDLTTNSLLICDKFTVTSHNVLNNISENYIALESSYTNDNYIKIRKPNTTDLATFKNWLTSNPVTIVYALATPTTEDIQVSPTDNPLQSYVSSTTLTTNNTMKGSISADIPTNVNAIIVNQASEIAKLQDDLLKTQALLIDNVIDNA